MPVRFEVPGRRYSAVRFLVTCGYGDADVPVTFVYADGSSERQTLAGEDWWDDPLAEDSTWGPLREGIQPILNGMDWIVEGSLDEIKDAALFEVTLDVDARKKLIALVLESAEMVGNTQASTFNLLAATGVWVETGK